MNTTEILKKGCRDILRNIKIGVLDEASKEDRADVLTETYGCGQQ